MNHPHDDDLLLLAYGELDAAAVAELESHLATCDLCRDKLVRLERARAALSWRTPKRTRSVVRWAAVGALAAAAAVAGILLSGGPPPDERPLAAWPQPLELSPTAGYLAGGKAVITIDEQLTRLERERSYVTP